MSSDYPPAGTWDVIDRHGEPRYVVEHDGKGGWWGVCQPDRPEDCHVLAASKDLLVAAKEFVAWAERAAMWDKVGESYYRAKRSIAKAEGR